MRTVEQVKNEIEEINGKLELGVPADKAHYLQMDKVALQDELKELEQAQELPTEEASAFETDGLLEQIAELKLFEAIEPEPADGERLHEYDERRKEHNLIIYIFTKEKEEAKDKHYQGIISAKDNEYQKLLESDQQKSEQLNNLENDYEKLLGELTTETNRVNNAESLFNQLQQNHNKSTNEVERLTLLVESLERQIEASKRTEATSSADLQERVANLKAKTKTADDFMKQYFERNNMALPDVEAPEINNEADEAETFQDTRSAEEGIPHAEQGTEQQDCGSNEQAVRADAEPETFEEEVRRRLTTLELKVNKNDPEFFHEVA